MKSARLIFVVAMAAMLVGSFLNTAFAEPTTAPAPTLSTSPGAEKIREAATPSQAVEAYAAAAPGVSGDDLNAVERAYVRRMIDFGLPEMAEAQAAELTRHTPDDGVAWGVLGFMSARRNKTDDALVQM